MSADRDVTRIVRSWLEDGATALPDRVLDQVLDQLPTTPQRRAWWPARRFRAMNLPARIAVAAAVVAVVAVVGVGVVPRGGGVGDARPTVTPVPTPSPTPVALPSAGALAPGVYAIGAGAITPVRMTFTVPAGWSTSDGLVYKLRGSSASPPRVEEGDGVMLFTWVVSHVYTDVCHWQGTLKAVGTTADQLAAVLHDQKGRTASSVTDSGLDGLPARRLDLTVPAGLDVRTCDNGIIRFWPDPGPDESGGLCCSPVGSTDVVYALVGGGKSFTVVARHQANSSAQDLAELDQLVASIRFEP